MVNWHRFTPSDFEYDFEKDKLAAHAVTFEEAVECFFADFEVGRNKSFSDRDQLVGRSLGGRGLKIIFPTEAGQRRQNHYGVGVMSNKKRVLSEQEIDEAVTGQADEESAWEKPRKVRRSKVTPIVLPSELAARAAFFARLHHTPSVEDWLRSVVQERIELEEAAFAELKREFAAK